MYTPNLFKVDPTLIQSFLQKYSFATVIATKDQKIEATHIPILVSQDLKSISFHVAFANPIKQFFDANPDALVIFQGPHSYISPRWYTEPNVPTWNYTAVHFAIKIRRIQNQSELLSDLKRLVSRYETQDFAEKMFVADGLEMVEEQTPAIIGYEAEVVDIQAKFKISQNRDPNSIQNVIQELKGSELSADIEMGKFMEDYFHQRNLKKDS